jgi:hypothetical protein
VNDLQRIHETNLTIFAACGANQTSHELVDWNNGAFTKVLIDGLTNRNNNQQLSKNGEVTIAALGTYLTEYVPALTKEVTTKLGEIEQRPEFQPMQIGDPTPLALIAPKTVGAAPARESGVGVHLVLNPR